ncbi:MAG: response regulator [Anaerolinea sp.]|nr:response regulator [Anaerolinea sp.]MCC6975283.1 response regulator [Anaerolineae bacterium]CAG1004885.1 Transcriptional regulatory protein ZraR [Anaerolineae bacterium]
MRFEGWRLLVIEDDPDGREVLIRIFRHYNIWVNVVKTAEEALEALRQDAYTAIVIDLALPGMDGWTFLSRLRAMHVLTPCFAITAYHSSDVAVKAIRSGFIGYMPKPIEAGAFVRELERVLAPT